MSKIIKYLKKIIYENAVLKYNEQTRVILYVITLKYRTLWRGGRKSDILISKNTVFGTVSCYTKSKGDSNNKFNAGN